MPEIYLKIKKALKKKGMGDTKAKSIAAGRYNKLRKKRPSMPKMPRHTT